MKWKNYGLWVSLASILYMVFKDLGVQIDLTAWETYVTAILGLLGALGIISNPDKGKGFFDKIPDTPVEAISQVTEQLQNQNQPPASSEGNSPQNHVQNPPNIQQYQNSFSQYTLSNTPHQQDQYQSSPAQTNFQGYQNQATQFQNEYKNYQDTPSGVPQSQQNQANINTSTNTQEVEPSQVQSEVNINSNQYTDVSDQEHALGHSSYERSSIHGMPAPPNEHM